ncbi:MFS transporter [Paenibacillus gansuensis]|uniref:MFS transporter n=1 Tax=Paenibacillus gansuensis TaxID=306542 RepID=A0ABW5PJC5_9BACL
MRQLFANRAFVTLFFATFASQLGTTIGNMAFAFYMLYRFAAKPAYATLAEMMYALPTLAVFLLVGVAADRFDRKRIAENTGWIRLGLTGLLIGALLMDWIGIVFGLLFIRSAVGKFYMPAEQAMLQGILEKDQYVQASGLNQMIMGIFMLFGVALGAVTYNGLGIVGAVAVDGCGFLLSALLIRFTRISHEVRLPNGRSSVRDLRSGMMVTDFKEGLKYIFGHKLLMVLLAGYVLFGFLNGGFAVLPMFTMKYKLAPDAYETFSSLFAVFLGLGILAGSMVTNKLLQKFKSYQLLISGILLTAYSFNA